MGEQANGSTSSTTYTNHNGSILTEQLNIPPAPTLSNGSNTYYNQLNAIINTGGATTDTTFAIAVSTNNFTSTLGYVSAAGTIGASQVYQSYIAWGSGSGTFVTGLSPSTTYELRVAAMQGKFTNTNFGAYATATTAAFTTSFSISPNSLSLGTLLPGSVTTSSSLTMTFATTAAAGGDVYVYGLNSGLNSANRSYTIAAASTNLATASSGFGIQATSATETYGGPLTILAPYNGSANNVGTENTAPAHMFTSSTAILGGSASINVQAKSSNITPSASDYSETLTFIGASSY